MKTVVTKLRRSKMDGRIEELSRAIEVVNHVLNLELDVEETLLYEQMLKNYKTEFELLTNKGGTSNDI